MEIRSDSQVVVGHIKGEYEAKSDKMKKYFTKVRSMMESFDIVVLTKVPREDNTRADALARISSSTDEEIARAECLVQEQTESSITQAIQVAQIEEDTEAPEWVKDVIRFLKERELPDDKKSARKVRVRAARYIMIGNTLYRRGYTLPLLKCLFDLEAKYVLKEIHEGDCGSHSEGRMLAHKAVWTGYYWPDMNKDSSDVVKHCDK